MDGGGEAAGGVVAGGSLAGGAAVGAAVGADADEHAASAIVSRATGPTVRNANDRLSIGRPPRLAASRGRGHFQHARLDRKVYGLVFQGLMARSDRRIAHVSSVGARESRPARSAHVYVPTELQ